MTEWIISDHHFGHSAIISMQNRPFKDLEHMHRVLVDSHNAKVKDDDTVYMIGDFFLKHDPSRAFRIVEKLKGYKIFIPGNHDHPRIYKYFDEFHSSLIKEFDGLGKTLLIHHPIYPEHSGREETPELKYKVNYGPMKKNKGKYKCGEFDTILCGHIHSAWLTMNNCINVSVEMHNYAPVSLEELAAIKNE